MPVSATVPRAVEQRLQRAARACSPASAAPIAIEERRHEIDLLHRRGDAPSRRATRGLHDQRNARRLLVEEQPVFLLAVIAKPFAVVRQTRSMVERS